MCDRYIDNIEEDITDLDFSPFSWKEKLQFFGICISVLAVYLLLGQMVSDWRQNSKQRQDFPQLWKAAAGSGQSLTEGKIPPIKIDFLEKNPNENEQLNNLIDKRDRYTGLQDCAQAWFVQQQDCPCLNKWQTNF